MNKNHIALLASTMTCDIRLKLGYAYHITCCEEIVLDLGSGESYLILGDIINYSKGLFIILDVSCTYGLPKKIGLVVVV